jgi:hypothetical protein
MGLSYNTYTRLKRDSNMELLRIVAMLLVMIVHASFLAVGVPKCNEAVCNPISTLSRFFSESLSVVCVNVFVLLSGWYGIKIKKNKILELIFQVLFFSVLVYCSFLLFDFKTYFNVDKAGTVLLIHSDDYWFIKSYLGLCIFAPLINSFIERSSEKQLRNIIIVFYLFQTIYGWLFINGADWFGGGYSAVSFVGLYMLARYVRLYLLKYTDFTWKKYLCCFFIIAIFQTILAFAVTYLGLPIAGRLFTYTNPFVIIESLCLLLAFNKMKFQSSLINWIATSCLAVYLLHANELFLRPYYGMIIHNWFINDNTLYFLIHTIFFISLLFLLAILIDKVRIYIWNQINRKFI